MRTNWMRTAALAATVLAGSVAAMGQTSLALSGYGAFSGTTNGNGTAQSPSNAAGAIVELRHIQNALIGYEATYSWNRANQSYRAVDYACPAANPGCPPPDPVSVPANAHEITGDWVVSVHFANIRPFALAGVGVLLNQPANSGNTTSSTKAVYVYGAGLDWGLLPHIGLRLQYRGNLYKAPDLTVLYTSTDKFTHTAQPMIGAYFRF